MTAPDPPTAAASPYRLRIPPLDLAGYRRMNTALLRPLLRAGAWRRLAWITAGGCVVGGLGGVLASIFSAELTIWLMLEPDIAIELEGARAFMALIGLILLALLLVRLLMRYWHGSLLRKVHAGSAGLFAEHELRLGADGLAWSGPEGTTALHWSAVQGLLHAEGTHYLRLGAANCLWLPDGAFATAAERAEVLAFIRDRMALGSA